MHKGVTFKINQWKLNFPSVLGVRSPKPFDSPSSDGAASGLEPKLRWRLSLSDGLARFRIIPLNIRNVKNSVRSSETVEIPTNTQIYPQKHLKSVLDHPASKRSGSDLLHRCLYPGFGAVPFISYSEFPPVDFTVASSLRTSRASAVGRCHPDALHVVETLCLGKKKTKKSVLHHFSGQNMTPVVHTSSLQPHATLLTFAHMRERSRRCYTAGHSRAGFRASLAPL